MKPTYTLSFLKSNFNYNISKSKIPLVLLLGSTLLLWQHTQAQQQEEVTNQVFSDLSKRSAISLQVGGNSYFGDLGGTKGTGKPFVKDFNIKSTNLFTGLSYSYFVDNGFSVNGDVHFTGLHSADSYIDKRTGHALGRYDRNLSFKSFLYEAQVTGELYPLYYLLYPKTSRLMPYIGAGVGVFHFNPKTKLNGDWYYLQPLHTEGQGFPEYPERKEYKLTQMYIPLSVGVKYRISENYMLSLNAIFRKTFTDYLDDVSTTYIDPALFDQHLSTYAAGIAKQLYYRGLTSPTPSATNNARGLTGNDSYTSVFLSLTYLLK